MNEILECTLIQGDRLTMIRFFWRPSSQADRRCGVFIEAPQR